MAKRFKMSRSHSRKSFSKHADRTHKRNISVPRKSPMRGGIRL